MAFDRITHSLGALALLANAIVLCTLLFLLLSRLVPGLRGAWTSYRGALRAIALPGAWIVATIATLGSLYFSEIAKLQPCKLCWFQRIAMYPLVVLLGIAALRSELWVAKRYFAPVALLGSVISIYHYQLERFPQQAPLVCTAGAGEASCSVTLFTVFNFISIPYMAGSAFLLIATLLLVAREQDDEEEEEAEGDAA